MSSSFLTLVRLVELVSFEDGSHFVLLMDEITLPITHHSHYT
jgi:hypothetical protein